MKTTIKQNKKNFKKRIVDADDSAFYFPICNKCKHLHRAGNGCDAFPDVIPDEIINGLNDHSKPLPKQYNNIVFEENES